MRVRGSFVDGQKTLGVEVVRRWILEMGWEGKMMDGE